MLLLPRKNSLGWSSVAVDSWWLLVGWLVPQPPTFILLHFSSSQLLRHKADVNFINEHGNTPLHYACFWGYGQIAEDLVQAGASVSISNKYGEVPLDKCRGAMAKKLHSELFVDLVLFT